MLDVFDIAQEEGKKGVEIFKRAIAPYNATGKTQKSAYYKIEGSSTKTILSILARGYTQVLETGSKPAKTHKPSRAMLDELAPWAQSRGIPEEAVYAIAVNLLKEGQQVNRNVYTDQMNEWADGVADRVASEFAGYAVDKMVNSFQ